ncbi:hypothetical protein WS98_08895 [Burkholderia territorii]|nr:hypothetical protein WS98_08895 [Burkholderia territorii]KWH07877.1 hypothetical protein WT58_12925 [Burkholderia territorii]
MFAAADASPSARRQWRFRLCMLDIAELRFKHVVVTNMKRASIVPSRLSGAIKAIRHLDEHCVELEILQ